MRDQHSSYSSPRSHFQLQPNKLAQRPGSVYGGSDGRRSHSYSSGDTPRPLDNRSSGSSIPSRSSSGTAIPNARFADSRDHPGYVADMPPRDFFTSGASRNREARWSNATGGYRGGSIAGRSCYAPSQSLLKNPRQYDGAKQYATEAFEDDHSVAPSDSISQVSSGRRGRAGSSKRSSQMCRRDSGVSVGPSEEDREDGFGEDEQPFWDKMNECWVRIVTPASAH